MTAEPLEVRFDETTPREELLEALHHLNTTARRMPQIVGTPALLTPWDRAHRTIDHILELIAGR